MSDFDEILRQMHDLENDLTGGDLEYITKLEKWYILRRKLAIIQADDS